MHLCAMRGSDFVAGSCGHLCLCVAWSDTLQPISLPMHIQEEPCIIAQHSCLQLRHAQSQKQYRRNSQLSGHDSTSTAYVAYGLSVADPSMNLVILSAGLHAAANG